MQETGEDKREVWANCIFINWRKKPMNSIELQNKHEGAGGKPREKPPRDRLQWLGQSWRHEPECGFQNVLSVSFDILVFLKDQN